MPQDSALYEYYRQKFIVTEYKDDCVFRTRSEGHGWFPGEVVDGNISRETNIIYAAPNDAFSEENCTIRKKKKIGS